MTASKTAEGQPVLHVAFEMYSRPCCLPVVRATVSHLAAMVGWDESECRTITLAIDEALANVIRHAYRGRADERIELHCDALEGELRFRLRDNGDPPDHTRICAREVGCDKIGGLGTHIIRDVMDSVFYETRQEGNWFLAVKRLRRQA